MLHDDTIIEAIVKGELELHKLLSFVGGETHSVDTAKCLYVKYFSVSLGIPTENSSCAL